MFCVYVWGGGNRGSRLPSSEDLLGPGLDLSQIYAGSTRLCVGVGQQQQRALLGQPGKVSLIRRYGGRPLNAAPPLIPQVPAQRVRG